MRKNTKITIYSKNGIKSFEFGENFIFQLKILLIFFIFLVFILLFAIFHINSKNQNLRILNKTLYEKNINLNKKNIELSSKKQNEIDEENEQDDWQITQALNDIKNELSKQKSTNLNLNSDKQSMILRYIPNGLPIKYKGVTSEYGSRIHPISKVQKMHHGIDLRASVGTEIYATADGFVEFSGNSETGYGYLVILSHNYGFKTRYGHLYAQNVVKAGQWVKKGDLIGYSGNTGYSTGPHLHYEVRFLERTLDPKSFINWNQDNFKNIPFLVPIVPWNELSKAVSE